MKYLLNFFLLFFVIACDMDADLVADGIDCDVLDPNRSEWRVVYFDQDGDGYADSQEGQDYCGDEPEAGFTFNVELDNCPETSNPLQEDFDSDGIGDHCDDSDNDEILDFEDNCKLTFNPEQLNQDGDSLGDLCDLCPNVQDQDDGIDSDGDGVPDSCDFCPDVANEGLSDIDADGTPDDCDLCPRVAHENPRDRDRDGIPDDCDLCPNDPNQNPRDNDGDGTPNVCDPCPDFANEDLRDSDNDGEPDDCDLCPQISNQRNRDDDGDGIPNDCDECPDTPAQIRNDHDEDGIPDDQDQFLACRFPSIWNNNNSFQNCPDMSNQNLGDYSDGRRMGANHGYSQYSCDIDFINLMWEAFDFDRVDWDQGYGYDHPCDPDFPLNRTLNGMWALYYSGSEQAERDNSPVWWGYNFAISRIDEVDAICNGPGRGTSAQFFDAPFIDDRVELYYRFFDENFVVIRSAILVHEAGHSNQKVHLLNDDCQEGTSCDPNWQYNGANTHEVCYSWSFGYDAINTTQVMKNRSKDSAEYTRIFHFRDIPEIDLEQRNLIEVHCP